MPRKGGNYERELCRQLTHWWTGDPESDVIFWRTSQSGGRVTQRAKSKKNLSKSHCGDISALGPEGRELFNLLVIEAKRGYPKASIHALLDRTPESAQQIYEEWIEQARTSARQAGVPYWLIVHKRNGRMATVMMPEKMWLALGMDRRIVLGVSLNLEIERPHDWLRVACCHWDQFLAVVRPDMIRELA